MSRRQTARRRRPAEDADAFSILEFCRRHGFSRPHYYRLRELGLTPDEIKLGTRVVITREAAEAWRREHSKPSKRGNPVTAIATTA
jgi:hypothetical protein